MGISAEQELMQTWPISTITKLLLLTTAKKISVFKIA
jgi:hypothetical protein